MEKNRKFSEEEGLKLESGLEGKRSEARCCRYDRTTRDHSQFPGEYLKKDSCNGVDFVKTDRALLACTQSDQMARLFVNIRLFGTMKISPMA